VGAGLVAATDMGGREHRTILCVKEYFHINYPLFSPPDPARVAGALVTFEPGSRTAWHTYLRAKSCARESAVTPLLDQELVCG